MDEMRFILDSCYGIKLGQVQRVFNGLSNRSLICSSSLGKITIRLPQNNHLTPQQVTLEDQVSRFLSERGLPIRQIIKTASGSPFVITRRGSVLTVFRFISGRYASYITAGHLTNVGRTLYALHQALRDFAGGGQLIHGDFNPGNFVFKGSEISGIYDLEHARFGEVTEDLATLLAHYVFLLPEWPPSQIIETVLAGYPGLSAASLIPLVRQKGEWLASWQQGDPNYFVDRLRQLC